MSSVAPAGQHRAGDRVAAGLAGELRAVGLGAGLDAVGFAGAGPFDESRVALEQRREQGLHAGMQFTYRNPARSTDPSRLLPGARALVVGARSYLRRPPEAPGASRSPGDPPVAPGPTARIARYSWIDHYEPLREALEVVAVRLRADGWRAVVVADDNSLVDRAAAQRAGLGWFGKNTMLLLPGAGSWYVLGSVVTDAPLAGNERPVADGCGTCRRCGDACPTGALDTPGVLDARRCLAWLVQAPGTFPVEHRVALGDRLYGCDECQEVCPVNRLGARRRPPLQAEEGARSGVDALAVLAADDAELLAEWGRWYIPDRDPVHLRRNALLVLANVADPAAEAVKEAVATALRHPAGLVRAHAVWAARRLGYDDLLGIVAGDGDARVAAEADPACHVSLRTAPAPPRDRP